MRNLFFLPLLLSASIAAAQGIEFHHGTWSEALAKAKAEGKHIFVDAFTTWCGPCKMMTRNIFPTASVGAFYNQKFINVKLDMEDGGDGTSVGKEFAVNAYPTYLFLSPEGALVHRGMGYMEADKFLALGEEVFAEGGKLADFEKKYNGGDRSPKLLFDYVLALKKLGDERAASIGEEYLRVQTDWNTPEAMTVIMETVTDPYSKPFEHAYAQRDAFEKTFGGEAFGEFLSQAITQACLNMYMAQGVLPEKESKALFNKYVPEKGDELFYRFRMQLYNYAEDWKNYPDAAVEYVEKYRDGLEAATLNTIAWTFYEQIDDRKMLEKALEWALASVKAEKGYYNMDTAASLFYKLKNKKKAKKYAEEAIKLAKAAGEDYNATEELLAKIKKM